MRCAIFPVLFLTSCATVNQAYEEFRSQSDTTKGAVIGGAAGAVVGTVLGSQVGSPVEGFALGTAAGAGVGALVGSAIESQKAKDEQAEYERQVASMQIQKEQFVYVGSEHGTVTRRERVAPSDRYFHRLATANQNAQRDMPSRASGIGVGSADADQFGQKVQGYSGTYSYDSNTGRQEAWATSATSPLVSSTSNTSSVNNVTVVAAQPTSEQPGQNAARSQEKTTAWRKPDRTESSTKDSSILSKNPYTGAEQKTVEAKNIKNISEQPVDLGSRNIAVNQNAKLAVADANQNQAASEQIAQASDSQKGSMQTDSATNLALSSSQNQISSNCPEGDAELRKAAEATEFSGKLFHTRRAVRLCNNYIPGKLALARLYIELKRYEDAQFELENLLKIDPSNREAMELLNKTKQMM